MKLSRGQKLCKHCGAVNAARSHKCNDCGKLFISKNTPIKNEVKNWKELEKGQHIKIIQGTGPYYICSSDSDDHNTGEKIYMGCKGKYVVREVTGNGLLCYGIGKNNTGIDFVYMGNKELSQSTGIIKAPHRIVILKPRKRR
jgi:hypothetical protein|tara:strand:+ start:534 stop:959 length:426 start_codon:yes stop_codon:yes gene_type:complete